MNDPECYGKFPNGTTPCAKCDYFDSCRYYAATAKQAEQREKHLVSFEKADFLTADLTDEQHIPGLEDETGKSCLIDLIGRFFRYLLELDDYTLAMISKVIAGDETGQPVSVSALGNQLGCSRQAVHRKLLTIIAEHPELAVFFGRLMTKLSRSRSLCWRHRRNEYAK